MWRGASTMILTPKVANMIGLFQPFQRTLSSRIINMSHRLARILVLGHVVIIKWINRWCPTCHLTLKLKYPLTFSQSIINSMTTHSSAIKTRTWMIKITWSIGRQCKRSLYLTVVFQILSHCITTKFSQLSKVKVCSARRQLSFRLLVKEQTLIIHKCRICKRSRISSWLLIDWLRGNMVVHLQDLLSNTV